MQALQEFFSGSRRIYAIVIATIVLLVAIVLATGVLGGDGSPREFTAQSFVDAANDEGAGIVLGDPLINAQENVKVYGISFEKSGGSSSTQESSGEEHGGASLTISPDSDSASQVYDQCEATGTFKCFRANNAALVFDEGADPHALANVVTALQAMAGS